MSIWFQQLYLQSGAACNIQGLFKHVDTQLFKAVSTKWISLYHEVCQSFKYHVCGNISLRHSLSRVFYPVTETTALRRMLTVENLTHVRTVLRFKKQNRDLPYRAGNSLKKKMNDNKSKGHQHAWIMFMQVFSLLGGANVLYTASSN